uniref:AlNc14C119G6626 protein n=1 Tax=Albugo laibachii Nc14 TaxID=890382 RepID=F0WJ95_9STRA|nr:AlNc14C119G6626 [Albugo laibachii Nc14]CCA26613.1 AlNc14C395G11317 [Albugo laibachii Nc14]|eukprot:CCA26613.1 AlNc14C395G11317 [Albugo laibachii Nc14]
MHPFDFLSFCPLKSGNCSVVKDDENPTYGGFDEAEIAASPTNPCTSGTSLTGFLGVINAILWLFLFVQVFM